MGVEEYIQLIKAALKRVESGYYRLATTYEPSGIVRERAFCYELYHQMRSSMGPDHTLSLNGEIDKRGHIDFKPKDRKNPDFVFHIPGTHDGNTIVVEVKGTLERPNDILKDFRTLLTFVGRYHYRAAVFILYNHTYDELVDTFGQQLAKVALDPCAGSVYILSKVYGRPCEEHQLVNHA